MAAGVFLAAALVAAYWRAFPAPFLFDDVPAIADNPTIRHLGAVFSPPLESTVGGRPVLNLSLAANYAVGGTSVWGYHAANLAIHVLAGLALFGIVRRTLALRGDTSATLLGFCVSLLWALHPIQTESVTYVIQRAESLMGLLYLLTLYCFIRGAEVPGARAAPWFAASIAACLLGMGTKEVMVSAPLIVLLYDRTFLSGSFREAWSRHRRVYLGLASTWLLLAGLVLSAHGRGGTAGYGSGVPWWRYALTQLPAIVRYLRLCFWPDPLIFDYGRALEVPSLRLVPCALAVAGLAAATAWALVKRPALGFLGAWFFAILAPSSSVVPVATETIAEHRMYLALVPVVVLAVAGIRRLAGPATLPVCLALAASLFAATWRRNAAYRTDEAIWSDTVAKLPGNERAHDALGYALALVPGRIDEAIAQYRDAIRLDPGYAQAHGNLAAALLRVPGRVDEAVAEYQEALRLQPDSAEVQNSFGGVLVLLGRTSDAIPHYEEALRLRPNFIEAHYNLGCALDRTPGRLDDAIAQYREAVRLRPDFAEAHYNLGCDLQETPGRLNDAIAQYEEALRARPDYAEAHNNLGSALQAIPARSADAIAHLDEAVRLRPDFTLAQFNLACALAKMPGRPDEAVAHYREAIRLKPDYAEARCDLANALSAQGRAEAADAEYREALRLDPDNAVIHLDLAIALLRAGRRDPAAAHLREAIRLQPDNAVARKILARLGAFP